MIRLSILFVLLFCHLAIAQVDVAVDVLPNTETTDSTAILNNNLRLNQNAINTIGSYFGTNGALQPSSGGTGRVLSSHLTGAIWYDDGTEFFQQLAPGTAGASLVTNGPGLAPSWGGHSFQLFTSSGTFTAPSGITTVYLTMVGSGGGGAGGQTGDNEQGGGGGGGQGLINYPYTVIPANNYTVTIGAAGTGGADSTSGVDGGNVLFDAITVSGGKKGTFVNGGTGSGGLGGGRFTGGSYMDGLLNLATGATALPGGNGASGGKGLGAGVGGGASIFGNGGTAPHGAATGYGAGGAGGFDGTASAAGGNGSKGIVIVQY